MIDNFFNFITNVVDFIFKPSSDIIELNDGQLFFNQCTVSFEVNLNHSEVRKRILQQINLTKTIKIK